MTSRSVLLVLTFAFGFSACGAGSSSTGSRTAAPAGTRTQALQMVQGAESDLDVLRAHHDSVMVVAARMSELYVRLSQAVEATGELSEDLQAARRARRSGEVDRIAGELDTELERLHEMNQSFSLQYLSLQQVIQQETRAFNLLSNVMKTKHESARNAINNIR